MKSLYPTLFLLLASFVCFAQDDDIPMPDYRSKKDNFTRVQEKDIRADLAAFAFAGVDESIGKQPLKSIPATGSNNNFMTFEGNNVKVIIGIGPFIPTKHKIGYYHKYVTKIDGKPFFGDYGSIPSLAITSVTAIIDNKDTVQVPQAALFDLYAPVFTYTDAAGRTKTKNAVYFSADNKTMYIYMLNREAKGSYEVTWVIRDKKYMRRVVDAVLK